MRTYRNFDVELFEHRPGAPETVRVRVAASSAGEQRLADAETVELAPGLRAEAARFAAEELDLAATIALGRRLAAVLLPGRVATLFHDALSDLHETSGLRLRLRLDDRALADLPWELAYLPLPGTPPGQEDERGFLALRNRISVVRYEALERENRPLAPVPGPLRLVGLLADPLRHQGAAQGAALDLAAERRAVEAAVAEVGGIELDWCPSGTLEDLLRGLDGGAQIFHFAGHGGFAPAAAEVAEGAVGGGGDDGGGAGVGNSAGGQGLLLLEGGGEEGNREDAGRPIPARDLARHLGGRGVRLAFLNACEGARRDSVLAWSGVAPALVQAGVPAVVAMQFTVGDTAAIAFGRRFYELLAAGHSVDEAVTAGRQAVVDALGAAGRHWAAPVLYLRRGDGVLFPSSAAGEGKALGQTPPTTRRTVVNAVLAAALAAVGVAWAGLRGSPFQALAVGGGVLTAVIVALGLLRWLLEDTLRQSVRRGLASRRATWVLAPLLAAALALAGVDAWTGRALLLRVVPTLNAALALPEVEKDPLRDCQLRLSTAGRELAVIEPFRRAIHYLGLDAAEAAALEGDAGGDAFGPAQLSRGFNYPSEAGLAGHLVDHAQFHPRVHLRPVDQLRAVILCGEGGVLEELVAREVEVASLPGDKIRTLFIP